MIYHIRETSLDKPNRGKSSSDFSIRTFHKVVQHIRLFRLLQHVQICLVLLATKHQCYAVLHHQTTIYIHLSSMVLDRASRHSQFL